MNESTVAPDLTTILLNTTTTTVRPADIDPPIRTCNYFVTSNNKTVVFDFSNNYGGIPQNVVFNLIGWSILMILFAILRRAAGNYGRWALVRKEADSETKWTQLFYAPDDVSVEEDQVEHETNTAIDDSIDYSAEEAMEDRRIGGWIRSIFTLSDEKFLHKCGIDAVQYLKFQRHLIFFTTIITVACICIILPINFQGTLQGTDVDFGHTTISNLKGTDNILWVHVVLVILFLPLGIAIMRHFSVNLGIRSEDEENDVSPRTLMISGVPDTYCTKEFIHRHVTEAYGDETIVEEVQIAYDVSKLAWLDQKRENAKRARMYCESYAQKYGAGQQMKPITCGIMCLSCNCCGNATDAMTFYKKEESEFASEVQKEKARVKTKSIGIAFVTFRKLADAKRMLTDHRSRCRCLSSPSSSSLSTLLEPWDWTVRIAPPPEDIYWENLNERHRFFFAKTFLINFFVFIFLFFFTSPAYIISQLELILNLKDVTDALPEKINDFVPTLLLWTFSALLPIIVAYSDWWMGHWRRSVENLWIMRKVFFYLLCMVLILPSVGMTSLRAFLQMFIESAQSDHSIIPSGNSTLHWNCIFLPDNGAFFVNYVITSALVGTALEFMRFSELFMYAMRLSFARSTAELPSVRAANLYEFPFGFNYGWMLLIFALTVAYGVVCPLITPFGLFYLVMKHGVDRYNLYYAYKRSKINKNIHATAVNMVIVSLLIQQLILLFFNLIRGRSSDSSLLSARAIFSITMFSIFLLLFLAQVFFHIFKGISPIQYTYKSDRSERNIQENSHQESPPNEQENGRQFVGFCNPEEGQNGQTNQRPPLNFRLRKGHKKYLPNVLKNDSDQHQEHLRPIITADSATFAQEQITEEPTRNSPIPAYGATEMTSPKRT